MRNEEKSASDLLGELLAEGRPRQVDSIDPATQLPIKIFAPHTERGTTIEPEETIKDLVAQYFSPEMSHRAVQFCRQLTLDFYADQMSTIPMLLKGMNSQPWRVTDSYLSFMEYLIMEAAAIGFPSILQAFSYASQELTFRTTQRSLFDIRNLLALRVYFADILIQATRLREKELDEMVTSDLTLPHDASTQKRRVLLEKIPALFGTMPKIFQGKVALNSINAISSSSDATYNRDFTTIYLPDMGQVESLLSIGRILNRPDESDRGVTFQAVGKMTESQAAQIFPDLQNDSFLPAEDQVRLVESAFGIPYLQAKSLMKAEFDHDQ